MSESIVGDVAAAIWRATSTFGLARSWEEESLPVRMGFESQARAAIAVLRPTVDAVVPRRRLRACVEQWPECETGDYDPACCRFPKSCSATVYDDHRVTDDDLEPVPDREDGSHDA